MSEKKYIATHYPHLLEEWDYEKNKGLDVNTITHGSNRKVSWRCKEGHQWKAIVANRANGTGCGQCSGLRHDSEYTFAVAYPDAAKEWHPILNKGRRPEDYSALSNKKAFWICEKNHVWEARIDNRGQGKGCPKCRSQTSFPEQAIYFYFKKHFPDAENGKIFKINNKRTEVDIYVKSLGLGIEYDGVYFHRDKEAKDREKSDLVKKHIGADVVRFREKGLPNKLFSIEEFYVVDNDLADHLTTLLERCGVTAPDIDIERDKLEITELYTFAEQKGNLKEMNPSLAAEWDYDRNGTLRPEMYKHKSSQKVYWRCSEAHSWKAEIKSRSNGNGCPHCNNLKKRKPLKKK